MIIFFGLFDEDNIIDNYGVISHVADAQSHSLTTDPTHWKNADPDPTYECSDPDPCMIVFLQRIIYM